MKHVPVLEVRIWEQRVGAVAPDPRLGGYVFAYAPAWRRTGIELAPLTMPLGGSGESFVFLNLAEATFHRLPGMLADALPDEFGNNLINAWMAQRGIAKSEVTELDRLSYMGRRGTGALEFRPAQGSRSESADPLEMKSLVEGARRLAGGDLSTDAHAQAALASIIRVGTSAGGARAKAVVAWNPKTDELRSGQFDAAPGFEHWLVKFDGIGRDDELGTGADYGRIEYAYYRMALQAGIEMSDCRLLEENGRAHFMTRRFDRAMVNGQTVKHHMQTLCAMDHMDFRQRGTNSYGQLFMAAARLKLGDAALDQIFRRMAFNAMARNCDDHTKNFSFRLKQGGSWELAPAYDVTHAYNPKGEWTYQHLMSVNGKFRDITRDDLLEDADRFGVRRPKDLLKDVREALESWPRCARLAGLGEAAVERVAGDFCLV
ncbi:MAG TPA: type II toxin-antitoxin system HipA family toxin [Candidatus Saccharimonadales bacterium]|jgi:serine/threonine-protein kinase HipA|nr:type II toxin-antitoxin system HipA family toxin [Candidatus Saccharimonadales bacterium]